MMSYVYEYDFVCDICTFHMKNINKSYMISYLYDFGCRRAAAYQSTSLRSRKSV